MYYLDNHHSFNCFFTQRKAIWSYLLHKHTEKFLSTILNELLKQRKIEENVLHNINSVGNFLCRFH